MSIKYTVIAIAVILLIYAFLNAFLKRRNLLNKKNRYNLILCTVIAIICTIVTPLFAKWMVQKLNFSIFSSVILSFLICVALSGGIYYLLKRKLKIEDVQAETAELKIDEVIADETIDMISLTEDEVIADETIDMISLTEDEVAATAENIYPKEASETQDDSTEMILHQPIDTTDEIAEEPEDDEKSLPTLEALIEEAHECKNNGERQKAIFLYESALQQYPDPTLLQWIVIDLCSLYKMTNQQKLIYKTLESEYCILLENYIKEEIQRNI